ncbi:MAG TPA: DUF58 domain-containing protein [Planctomycetota bacterium]|nr:DUF58 domain-containing protein [Planctomycetota bacterium]
MIPRELVKKLRRIEIVTSRLAQEQLAGGYHSAFRGLGMTYTEARPYQPGDDVRFIDWNASARMNDAFVKVFTEEREMTVMLAVDLSASQRFGTAVGSKAERAAELAALLAFSAIQNGDRVGLLLFTDRIEAYVPPKKGRGHVMRVVTQILNAKPQGTGTDLSLALEKIARLGGRRSVCFLLSDFMGEARERSLSLAANKHDLVPVEIVDPREEELPDVGLALLEDLETGELVEVDTSDPGFRDAYRASLAAARKERNARFRKHRLDPLIVEAGDDAVKALGDFFRARRKRMRTGR